MKNQTLLSIVMTAFVSGVIMLPATAQSNKPHKLQTIKKQTTKQENIIPQSAALVIAFPQGVQLDAEKDKSHPMTVLLAQPILDRTGREIVRANSPVSVKLVPSEGNIKIVTESIVVGGQFVPVQATSSIIPSVKKTVVSGNEKARRNSRPWARLGSSFVGAIGKGDSDSILKGGLAGNAIGILGGITSPKKVAVVSIPQGSVYILKLEAPVTLPKNTKTAVPKSL